MKTTALMAVALFAATWFLARVAAEVAASTIDAGEKLRIGYDKNRIFTHHKVLFAICAIQVCAKIITAVALVVTAVMWMAGV